METSDEIIQHISNIIEKLSKEGSTCVQIPFWELFANHIAFKNRFSGSEIKDTVCKYIDYILTKDGMTFKIPKETIVFRAREITPKEIRKDEQGHRIGFNAEQSGKPPYRKTPNGRVNIAGIPLLYTASEKETACAELRPMKNDLISVAEYKVKDDIIVANFVLEYADKFKESIEGQNFLKDMFESFSLPVSNTLIDYLPSEFISEHIRINHTELSGIRYSSLHNEGGYNIALFDDKNCEFIKSSVVQCNKVIYYYENFVTIQHPLKFITFRP